MNRNAQTINEEVLFDETDELISTTDLRGVLTYVNPAFVVVSGYTEDELIGKNHNIVRHPEMPSAAFKDLWAHLKAGKSWRGMVKNRCKDGRFYWVDAFVTPIKEGGKLVGYQSVRVKPNEQLKRKAESVYKALKNESKLATFEVKSSTKLNLALLLSLATSIAIGIMASWTLAIALIIFVVILFAIFSMN